MISWLLPRAIEAVDSHESCSTDLAPGRAPNGPATDRAQGSPVIGVEQCSPRTAAESSLDRYWGFGVRPDRFRKWPAERWYAPRRFPPDENECPR